MDKRIDPDTLLIGDKNAIVVVIRVSGYGNEYNTQVSCPACDTTQEYSFDLKDDVYMKKFDCCCKCYFQWVEGREERWKTGWRPNNANDT